MNKIRMRKLLSIVLSAVCVMALASCGTSASAETAETAAETAPEKAAAREDVTRAGWSLDDIEALSEVVTGITDREYAAGEGAAYKIYEDVTYDRDVVYTVLFNTASVRFDTPGMYDMTYWVYFDAAALKAWADENGVSLDIPDAGRLAVWVSATVTVTEAEDTDDGDAEDDADEADEDTASGSSNKTAGSASGSLKGTASGSSSCSHVWEEAYDADRDVDFLVCSRCGATKAVSGSSGSSTGVSSGSSKSSSSGSSSKSTASGSSKSSSSTSCSHNWVDEGHYESVLVQAAYDEKVDTGRAQYVCNNCGYSGTDADDVIGHTQHVCNCGYHSEILYEYVHHDAVYKTQWVSSYKCSKCGATK